MLVSFTLTPMLCSRLLGRMRRKSAEAQSAPEASPEPHSAPPAEAAFARASAGTHASAATDNTFFAWIDGIYGKLLEWSLDHRGTVAWVAVATLALTFPR